MKLSRYCQRLVVLALMAVLVTGVAACGDDDSNGGGDQTSTAGAGQENAVKVGSEYTGGQPGKADASLSPISLGWVNQDESPAGSSSENTAAVKGAIRFVNEELGGIDGHPLKLVQCTIGGSEGQGTQCARKFVNDPEIKAVLYGQTLVGAQAFMSAMAPDGKESQKPVIGAVPGSPDDGALKNVYWTAGGFLANITFPVYIRDYLKAKSVSTIWADHPSATVFIDLTKDLYEAAGLEFLVAKIPPSGTDVVGPMVAGGVQEADAIQPFPEDPSQCIAVAKGAEQLNILDKPTVAYSPCLKAAVKDALGDYPEWIYFRDTLNPNVPDPSGQVDTFKYVAEKYAGAKAGDVLQGPFSANSFGLVMLAAKWFNAAGPDNITSEGVAEQAKAISGDIWMGDPAAKFGTPPYTSVASLSQRFYKYEGDGKWSDTTDGTWVTAPAEG